MRTETEAVESRRRGHVLIVDDDPDTQFIFLAALEYAGYRVRIEADGVGALVAIRQEVPDIVILDLAMPLLSGLEVLAQLKADSATRAIPVIACTATATLNDVPMLRDHGFAEVLLKPIDPTVMVTAVDRVRLSVLHEPLE